MDSKALVLREVRRYHRVVVPGFIFLMVFAIWAAYMAWTHIQPAPSPNPSAAEGLSAEAAQALFVATVLPVFFMLLATAFLMVYFRYMLYGVLARVLEADAPSRERSVEPSVERHES